MRIAAILVLAATPAIAQQQICAPIERLAEILREDHHEIPVAVGDARAGQIVVFATPDGATWTVVLVGPSGQACVAADGGRWRLIGRGA